MLDKNESSGENIFTPTRKIMVTRILALKTSKIDDEIISFFLSDLGRNRFKLIFNPRIERPARRVATEIKVVAIPT